MFKVRNGSGGALAIVLEKGSTILQPGKSIDLDGICSRKWIRADKQLESLLNSRNLLIIHDSEQGIPDQITKDVVGVTERMDSLKRDSKDIKFPKIEKKDEPIVIDLSSIGDVEEEDIIEEELSDPVQEDKKEELIIEFEDDENEWEDEKSIEKPPVDEKTCEICGKQCASERGLKIHMRVHKK